MKTNFSKRFLSSFYIGIERRSPYLLLPQNPTGDPNIKDQSTTNLNLDSFVSKTKEYQKIGTGHATLFDYFQDRESDIDSKLSELLSTPLKEPADSTRTTVWLAYDRTAYLTVRKLSAGGT
jgi:hypothetical protein